MELKRNLKRSVARVTGIEAALNRRVEVVEAKHAAERQRLERDLAAQEARADRAEYLYRTTRRVATGLKNLAVVFDRLPRFEYGSLLQGVERWSEKWASTTGSRILMFANTDYSGSFFKWAAAINDHTVHAARLVATVPHKYGYQLDLLLPNPALLETSWRELWDQADMLHLKDETGFFKGPNTLPAEMLTSFEGPKIFTQYGGYARKLQDDPDYRRFVSEFDRVVSMTPDLCFDWLGPNPIYIPHSIDTNALQFSWSDKPLIGHSPSTRVRKGTEEFLEAISQIQKERRLELDLIEGVSHSEVMARKRKLGLFFDQAGRESIENLGTDEVIGWYGNSAIEAAVFGIPTIAHLSEKALSGARRAGVHEVADSPFLNSPLGVDGLRATIEGVLNLTARDRSELAHSTREFVESFHSQKAVASRLNDLYAGLA